MTELILHHYDSSPFSEKIRLMFGLKNLAWHSVIVPDVAPKPDLYPLTGGYRHTPVLQIGADIYCDTRLIADEIDRRYPSPPLSDSGGDGLSRMVEAWAERDLFWPAARFLTGINANHLGATFHADRAALRGKQPPSPTALRRAARTGLGNLEIQLPFLENLLSHDRPYLLGDTPGRADLAAYHGLWFLSVFAIDCSHVLEPFERITAWMERIDAIGHGHRREMTSREALEHALKNHPEPIDASYRVAETVRVSVRSEDARSNAVEGDLALRAPNHIAVRREEPRVGSIAIHFPRLGYTVKEI